MQTKKEQRSNLNETQAVRAFWLSIGTGLVMLLVILPILLLTGGGDELGGVLDVRIFVVVLSLTGFISAWLARRGQAVLGVSLILGALFIVVSLTGFFIANIGVAVAAVTVTFTFGVTSLILLPGRLSRHLNTAAITIATVMLLLDIFQPFERIPNETPEVTWGLTFLLVLVYGSLVLRQFGSYTIRAKLTIAFLAAALIPLAILSFLNDRNTRRTLTNDANRSLLNAASLTAAELDTFINYNLDTIRTQANLPEIRSFTSQTPGQRLYRRDEIYSILSAFARQNPIYITSVSLSDAQGIVLADTYTDDIGTDKSTRSWLQEALRTGLPYASDLEFSQGGVDPSLYFSAPVRNAGGEIIGVLRTRYNAAILQDIVSSNNDLLGLGSFAVLLDGETHVRLAHGTTPSIIFKSVVPLDAATVSEMQAKRHLPSGSPEELSTNLPDFEAALDRYETAPFFLAELRIGDEILEQGAIVEMKTQHWQVVYAQQQDTFLAPIDAQTRTNLVLTLFIAVAVTGFALFVSSVLSGPIIRLTQTAESIAKGNLNVQAKVESGDEVGTLAETFNRMTRQLREFITSLEERVAARTKDLATVAEVGTATATILETDRLLKEVVELTKERFNLYHSHIYLLDEQGENLVLTAGAGEPGRIMAAEKRSIPLSREQSLVARAARERKGVTVNDVTLAPDFLPNPLLPNTRSELAVPMSVGETLVGVFDIQSEQVGRFTESDVNIQTTLASQIATSIQNARSYERSKAQADLETLANAIGQKIQRATTVEETLQTAVREIGVAIGAARVSAKLDPNLQSNDRTHQNN